MTASPSTLEEALNQLLLRIAKDVEDLRVSGRAIPTVHKFLRRKHEGYSYGERGPTTSSWQTIIAEKQVFSTAAINLTDSLKQTTEWKRTLEESEAAGIKEARAQGVLQSFVSSAIERLLEQRSFPLSEQLPDLLALLTDKPRDCGAKVEVSGLLVPDTPIRVGASGVELLMRRPTLDDVDTEVLPFDPPEAGFSLPSSILEVSLRSENPAEVQRVVNQVVTTLRLFVAAGVELKSYEMTSESLGDVFAGSKMRQGRFATPYTLGRLVPADGPFLRTYWGRVFRLIPPSFYDPMDRRWNYLTTAFDRYSDALLYGRSTEDRIAHATMGLESLTLRQTEQQELSYRLRIRLARILGLVGMNPHEVEDYIENAYSIRSSYVHGGRLSHERERELARRTGGSDGLFRATVNYLRIMILIELLIQRDKEELISLIDDSFVDERRGQELANMVAQLREAISTDSRQVT